MHLVFIGLPLYPNQPNGHSYSLGRLLKYKTKAVLNAKTIYNSIE